MDIIEIIHVSKKFSTKDRQVLALDDVSFQVKKGEIFGMLGPNGAGKSTLVNIILGILQHDRGRVKVMGEDIHKKRALMEKMNYVSGETRFHWVLTVRDVLRFYGASYGIPGKKLRQKIKQLLDFFGIEELAHQKFDSLSTGEKMRLIFAKALLNEPQILLFDEPTLGLDPQIAVKVRAEIRRVNKEMGTTILLTSHYMQEVEKLCDRIAFINKGKISDIGGVEKVIKTKFPHYELMVEVESIKEMSLLAQEGFTIVGTKLYKILPYQDGLSEVLSFLTQNGYKVVGIDVKKPTLEDYFIKTMEMQT